MKKEEKILVIGDIHGNATAFHEAFNRAQSEKAFLLSIGDLTDYGKENFECIRLMHDIIAFNKGAMIRGNHDFKLNKWIHQTLEHDVRIKLRGGVLETVQEYENLSSSDQEEFFDKFINIYDLSSFHLIVQNFMFVHGGAHYNMWNVAELSKVLMNRAIFGQVNGSRDDGRPNRIYNWVQEIPSDKYVVFGHDILSTDNITTLGNAYSIDTGSSKGGKLSGLLLESDGETFNVSEVLSF